MAERCGLALKRRGLWTSSVFPVAELRSLHLEKQNILMKGCASESGGVSERGTYRYLSEKCAETHIRNRMSGDCSTVSQTLGRDPFVGHGNIFMGPPDILFPTFCF